MNKLVRDKIPEMIQSEGRVANIKKVEGIELITALAFKLIEESQEVLEAINADDGIAEELGDLIEVYEALIEALNLGDEIERKRSEKALEKGVFKEGYYWSVIK